MKLGAFSISLAVKDLNKSKTFYETLGFAVFGGQIEKNYLILKNGNSLIGLFQGMFENNILTFENANKLDTFDDVRTIQQHLKDNHIKLEQEVDATTSGPASMVFFEPDGNTIMIDQHV